MEWTKHYNEYILYKKVHGTLSDYWKPIARFKQKTVITDITNAVGNVSYITI